MRSRIPPHISWPLFVIAILLTGVSAAIYTLIMAHADGGPQVVASYYQAGVDWDAAAERRAASEALGWQADVQVGTSEPGRTDRMVTFHLRDRNGHPLSGLTGAVRLSRPHLAQPIAQLLVEPVNGQPGTYQQVFPIQGHGLWDFTLLFQREDAVFEVTLRRDLAPLNEGTGAREQEPT